MERLSEFESELQPWQGRVLTVKHHSRMLDWSGKWDSNSRSPAPKAGALSQTKLLPEIILVEDNRIELLITACKAVVIPFN